MSLSIYQRIISDAFESKKWNYSSKKISDQKTVFTIEFEYDKFGTNRCKVSIFDNGVCDMETILPISCPREQYMELCYYFAQYNYLRRYSTLRLDVNDGEITNCYSFIFNQATTPKEFLDRFISTRDIDDDVLMDIMAICRKSALVEKEETSTTNMGKNDKHKLCL